jgi:hypothetical protein
VIFIHPGFSIQQQQQKIRGENLLSFLFCSHKYHKFFNYFIFEQVPTEQLDNIIVILPKNCQLSKLWVEDPESGLNAMDNA